MVSKNEHKSMLKVGTILRGIYRIDGYLASGGFGNTYLATNIEFDEQVAIKEFFMRGVSERGTDSLSISVSNEENVEMFEKLLGTFKREAKRLHKLGKRNIPHVVRVFDLFEENNTSYYVMQYINGQSLSAVLKSQQRPFDQQWLIEGLLPQMLEALGGIHAANLWHLDIKPSNIMIDNQGNVTLIDFGSSKQIDSSKGDHVTMSSTLSFTKIYAPLELLHYDYKSIGPWTDIYSLGGTLYNLATNQKPPGAYEILNEGVNAFRFPQGSIADLTQLIVWMMSYKVGDRPQSVEQINDIIKGVKGKNIPQPPKALQQPAAEPAQEVTVATPKPDVAVTTPAVDTSQEATIAAEPASNDLMPNQEADDSKGNRVRIIALTVFALTAILTLIIFKAVSNKNNDNQQSAGVEMTTPVDSVAYTEEVPPQVQQSGDNDAAPAPQPASPRREAGVSGSQQPHQQSSKSPHQSTSQPKQQSQPQPSAASSQPQQQRSVVIPKTAPAAPAPRPQAITPKKSSSSGSGRSKVDGVKRSEAPSNTER